METKENKMKKKHDNAQGSACQQWQIQEKGKKYEIYSTPIKTVIRVKEGELLSPKYSI